MMKKTNVTIPIGEALLKLRGAIYRLEWALKEERLNNILEERIRAHIAIKIFNIASSTLNKRSIVERELQKAGQSELKIVLPMLQKASSRLAASVRIV